MTQLARIHIAKKELGLDDDAYRDVLMRVTGKASSKDMTITERDDVINEMRRLGWQAGASKGGRKRLDGKYAPKLQALWISGWHLGIVRDRSDSALIAFVKRQTGLDHTRFLYDDRDARKVIEALKKWLEREGGVDWSASAIKPGWTQSDRGRIAIALVGKAASLNLFTVHLSIGARLETIANRPLSEFTPMEWVRVHKHLGERIRRALKEQNSEGGE